MPKTFTANKTQPWVKKHINKIGGIAAGHVRMGPVLVLIFIRMYGNDGAQFVIICRPNRHAPKWKAVRSHDASSEQEQEKMGMHIFFCIC